MGVARVWSAGSHSAPPFSEVPPMRIKTYRDESGFRIFDLIFGQPRAPLVGRPRFGSGFLLPGGRVRLRPCRRLDALKQRGAGGLTRTAGPGAIACFRRVSASELVDRGDRKMARLLRAHYALRRLIALELGGDPACLELSQTDAGKPLPLESSRGLEFNLSHSGG